MHMSQKAFFLWVICLIKSWVVWVCISCCMAENSAVDSSCLWAAQQAPHCHLPEFPGHGTMLVVRGSGFWLKCPMFFYEETDSETLPETLPVEENNSEPSSDEEREVIRDTSKLAMPEEYSGECLGDAVLEEEQHFCCIPAVLSMDELQLPSTQPWPAAQRKRQGQCCSLAHTGLFPSRTS